MNSVIPHSLFTEYDIYLFKSGKHFRIYEKMGSHIADVEGETGVNFAVWAPNAQQVSVVGNFNHWNQQSHPLLPRLDESGIWEGFIPGIGKGELYKYHIQTIEGRHLEKGDPYAFFWEIPPNTASIVWDQDYHWQDASWMERRQSLAGKPQPYSVYEVHLPSWKKRPGTSLSLGYRQLAEELVPYVKDMGYTHVELLPVMEHPYYPSWGYQVTGYFATTSRLGTPQDFKYLVDAFHQAGIGVILDWVPSHFPTDAFGLAQFDGTYLYEHADPRLGFHPDWKSAIFNFGRTEVRNFLISNAIFWLDQFHADGLRVDAVASMLYLDYSREEGEWLPNQYGGKENIEAISFLREFNETVYKEFPDAISIAEESTAWSGVSHPTYSGGLGFGQKWMMGWMHDTLNFFKNDPVYRKFHHGQITFSLIYAFTENFMLPLSHDEVVHGKGSLIGRMPGDEWQRFANLRLLYGYMYGHPGSKLLFMGGEFAQTTEWNIETGLAWDLTSSDYHQGVQRWVRRLNEFYRSHQALYEQQFSGEGFEWVDHGDSNNSILSFLRKDAEEQAPLVVVCNFTPVSRPEFRVGVPFEGVWKEVLNSDEKTYGGTGDHLNGMHHTEEIEWNGRPYSIAIKIAPLAVMAFEMETPPVKKTAPKGTKTKGAND
ncbi:MAG: 1,4-alpha-glucan branching protein GlgB [Haliscomenobacter sp.]|nr:1,4-alpha-glucan branching protein GlgB [Haliscomenobacter sp.]